MVYVFDHTMPTLDTQKTACMHEQPNEYLDYKPEGTARRFGMISTSSTTEEIDAMRKLHPCVINMPPRIVRPYVIQICGAVLRCVKGNPTKPRKVRTVSDIVRVCRMQITRIS